MSPSARAGRSVKLTVLVFAIFIAISLLTNIIGPIIPDIFASVLWPIINSLALNSLDHSHGAFAGILCTGIVGGAIMPLWIGQIGNHLGLRAGMMLLYLTFGWILGIGFWARPLIQNRTMT